MLRKPQDSLFCEKFKVLEGARKNAAAALAFSLSRKLRLLRREPRVEYLCKAQIADQLKDVMLSETVRSLVLRLD